MGASKNSTSSVTHIDFSSSKNKIIFTDDQKMQRREDPLRSLKEFRKSVTVLTHVLTSFQGQDTDSPREGSRKQSVWFQENAMHSQGS